MPGASNVLLYFKGGAVFAENRFEIENSGVTLGTPSTSRTGWTVGAGVEWAFAPNWSFFVQGDYYDLGKNATETFNNFFAVENASVLPPFTINTHTTYEDIKLGVNFRFGICLPHRWWRDIDRVILIVIKQEPLECRSRGSCRA